MLGALLSLAGSFLTNKLGRIVAYAGGGILALTVAYGIGNLHGRAAAAAKCNAAALRAQIEHLQTEIAARDLAATHDAARAAEARAEAARLEEKSREFTSNVGDRECLSHNDVDRLRDAWDAGTKSSSRRRPW